MKLRLIDHKILDLKYSSITEILDDMIVYYQVHCYVEAAFPLVGNLVIVCLTKSKASTTRIFMVSARNNQTRVGNFSKLHKTVFQKLAKMRGI